MKKILFAVLACLTACQSMTNQNVVGSAIKPPLPHLNLQVTEYQINPNRDTILYYKTGSKLHIPKNAFMKANGELVNTSVKLKYREFHSPVDIFLSGIPMQYDSAGTQYHFESAGMCELYGFEENNPLQIAKDKSCKIEMASQKSSTKFNLYQLDTASGVWSYLGKDAVNQVVATKPLQKKQKKAKKIAQDFPNIAKPTKPIEANPDRPWVQLDVNDAEYPELVAYKNVIFEVLETTPYNPENQKINWDKVSLKKGKKLGTYIIAFEKGDRKGEYDVQPVLQGEDYQAALKDYEQKFATYEATKKQAEIAKEKAKKESEAREKQVQEEMTQAIATEKLRQENEAKLFVKQEKQRAIVEEKRLREEERKAIAAEKLQQKQFDEIQKVRQKNENRLKNNENIAYRTIVAINFGVYNCDFPQLPPQGEIILASFIDNDGKIITTQKMTLIEKQPAISYEFLVSFSEKSSFQFNPNKENIIFCITDEGCLAYFPSFDFKDLPNNITKYDFQMRIHKEKLKSQKELETLLGI